MAGIDELKSGYERFRKGYFQEHKELFSRLGAEGQSPRTMIVGCSDSRAEPAIILDAAPGDLFVVRNVANLVPPYGPYSGHHGTSAALEFAVKGLKVENVIIMGHAQCGGINALLRGEIDPIPDDEFIGPWVSITDDARKHVLEKHAHDPEHVQLKALELRAIVASLDNLRSFPFIAEREKTGQLSLHGWYFDIEEGALLAYNAATDSFDPMSVAASSS